MHRFTCFVVLFISSVFLFSEYLIYYLVQVKCDWPELPRESVQLRALIISDTHLLGPYRGHWFDKLRREWQMSSAFMAATSLHSPDVIFFLGDIFDEGKWANEKQYADYVERFNQMFPSINKPHVIVGNHDVGFHYMMDDNKLGRFYKTFNITSSELIRLKGIPFVSVNSMALEGDGCTICQDAENKITEIAAKLKPGERPVLLQHFPLFRKSDELCQGEDSAPDDEKFVLFRPKFDCLSKASSIWLLNVIRPRVVFSGHTHHSCIHHHENVAEYSVPSFSWRYRNNPSYFLVTFSLEDFAVYKCFMPQESTVIRIYVTSLCFLIAIVLCRCFQRCRKRHIKVQ